LRLRAFIVIEGGITDLLLLRYLDAGHRTASRLLKELQTA